MPDITVPVPDERTAEFYQFFGMWLGGSLGLAEGSLVVRGEASEAARIASPKPKLRAWGNSQHDLDDAVALWRKYSRNARAMFGLLIDNPDREFTGGQIAAAVNIPNGAHGVAGVLAWPGRHGLGVSRALPTDWRLDPETFQSYYWVPAQRAELFKAARAMVEENR